MKTERYSKTCLHIEVEVLRAAATPKCRHFCEVVEYGWVHKQYFYLIMTRLGKNLHHLRAERKNRKFSLSTALRCGLQALEASPRLP